jgi:hypothetical protein
LQSFLFEIDETEIVVHEVDDPDSVVDLLDTELLTGEDAGDVDAFSVHADTSAGSDQEFSIVQGIAELG